MTRKPSHVTQRAAALEALNAEIATLKAELAAAKQAHLDDLQKWLVMKARLQNSKRRKKAVDR